MQSHPSNNRLIVVLFLAVLVGGFVGQIGCNSSSDDSDARDVATNRSYDPFLDEPFPEDETEDSVLSPELASATEDSSNQKKSFSIDEPWISSDKLPLESWEVHYLGNTQIGYTRKRASSMNALGSPILQMELENRMSLEPLGKGPNQEWMILTNENTTGEMRMLRIEHKEGDELSIIQGRVLDTKFQLVSELGPRFNRKIESDSPPLGPFALEESLLYQPMTAGEKRILTYIDPFERNLVQREFEAGTFTKSPLIDGTSMELLDLSVVGDPNLPQIRYWVSKDGVIYKSYDERTGLYTFKCDESFALIAKGMLDVDATPNVHIPLPKKFETLKEGKSINYTVTLKKADPFKRLVARTNQSVRSLLPFTSEVTVTKLGSKDALPKGIEKESPPDEKYLGANRLLQSDDPNLKMLAVEWRDGSDSKLANYERLMLGVHRNIEVHPFTKRFPSAVEVAQLRKGDSAGIAILYCAMARSLGIPTRVAMGLRGVSEEDGAHFMTCHAWNEVWQGDHWLPIDATDGKFPVSVDRIKMMESAFEDANPYAPFIAFSKGLDTLTIEVKE